MISRLFTIDGLGDIHPWKEIRGLKPEREFMGGGATLV